MQKISEESVSTQNYGADRFVDHFKINKPVVVRHGYRLDRIERVHDGSPEPESVDVPSDQASRHRPQNFIGLLFCRTFGGGSDCLDDLGNDFPIAHFFLPAMPSTTDT
jgi:hypothetical protein